MWVIITEYSEVIKPPCSISNIPFRHFFQNRFAFLLNHWSTTNNNQRTKHRQGSAIRRRTKGRKSLRAKNQSSILVATLYGNNWSSSWHSSSLLGIAFPATCFRFKRQIGFSGDWCLAKGNNWLERRRSSRSASSCNHPAYNYRQCRQNQKPPGEAVKQ